MYTPVSYADKRHDQQSPAPGQSAVIAHRAQQPHLSKLCESAELGMSSG